MSGNSGPQITSRRRQNHSELPPLSASVGLEQFARPGGPACNLLPTEYEHTQQPLQTTELFIERKPAEAQSDGVYLF
jgi:hypothetical protein